MLDKTQENVPSTIIQPSTDAHHGIWHRFQSCILMKEGGTQSWDTCQSRRVFHGWILDKSCKLLQGQPVCHLQDRLFCSQLGSPFSKNIILKFVPSDSHLRRAVDKWYSARCLLPVSTLQTPSQINPLSQDTLLTIHQEPMGWPLPGLEIPPPS